MAVWICIGVMVVVMAVLAIWSVKLQTKLKKACYIERRGDVLLLKDYSGKIIEENIIIEIK